MPDKHNGSAADHSGAPAVTDAWTAPFTRKGFLKSAAATGAGAAGLGMLGPAAALAKEAKKGGVTHKDLTILKAAQIAEALAVTTYTNIINTSPFFKNIPGDDQDYLKRRGRRRCPTTCSRKASPRSRRPSPRSTTRRRCSATRRPRSTSS